MLRPSSSVGSAVPFTTPEGGRTDFLLLAPLYQVSSQLLVIATDKRTPPTHSIGRLKDHLISYEDVFIRGLHLFFFSEK